MSADGPDVALHGNIDRVDPDGHVVGWCWSPDEPRHRRLIRLAIDGADVAGAVAAESRPDLAEAQVGDGAHGFVLRLDARDIPPQASSVLTLHDVATGRPVGSEMRVTWPRAAVAPLATASNPGLTGNLDGGSEEGWVSGWAWYPNEPSRRASLDVLVDDTPVGTTRASMFRADLQRAGIGDGRYAFAFALPWSVLARKGEMTLSVRDAATGAPFGQPVVVQIGRLVEVEERIDGLERQVRLLQARLVEQEQAADTADQDRAARELFRSVAAFFHDLGEAPNTTSPAGVSLRHAVGAVLDAHAPLAFAVPVTARATLLLRAAARDRLYACLAGLQEAGVDRFADIVLLDDGRYGADVALLPAIVRNLRYVRLGPGADAAAARTAVARDGRGEALVVLSPELHPASDAVAALLDALADAPNVALAAALVARVDGTLEHAGFRIDERGELVDPGRGAASDFAIHRPVDAVADLLFAVRRAALLDVGGFPPGYDAMASAVAGLCFALRTHGQVVIEPSARATLLEGGTGQRRSERDARRLRDSF